MKLLLKMFGVLGIFIFQFTKIKLFYNIQIKNKIGILSQNNKVKFIAVSEPNIKNPNKSFWKADQVRLK